MTSLAETFRQLAQPTTVGTFTASPLPNSPSHKVAKDHTGAPCLLLSVQESVIPRPAPIELEHLSIDHNTHCTIRVDDAQQDGHFTIIRCHDAPTGLHQVFLRVASPLTDDLPDEPTASVVNDVLQTFIELFRAATQPATKTLQGLWAELFLIAQAHNPTALVSAWHVTPEDRYDFATGPQRIEVKSTSSRVRQHHFSLEQLMPPRGTRVLIASIITERSAGGASIADLLDRITNDFPVPLQAHAHRITYTALGTTWRDAITSAFDLELATASLQFIDARAVPTVPTPLPAAITKVRFCADLTNAPALSSDELDAAGGLLAAAQPHRSPEA